jgi:hypothetical protein
MRSVGRSRGRSLFRTAAGIVLLALPSAVPAEAEVIYVDFEEFAAGQVVAGETPGGGTAPLDLFPFVHFSVANLGGGPHSLVIFDSSQPTGGDWDLGTPHQDFGGPGIGLGGAGGQPGENAAPLGNLLIIAENINDGAPPEGIIDYPDDEAGGGIITATFDAAVTVEYITLVDMDDSARGSLIRLYSHEALLFIYPIQDLGDNSVQTVSFEGYKDVTRMEFFFKGSGAIDNLIFHVKPTAVEEKTWGQVKSQFRS